MAAANTRLRSTAKFIRLFRLIARIYFYLLRLFCARPLADAPSLIVMAQLKKPVLRHEKQRKDFAIDEHSQRK